MKDNLDKELLAGIFVAVSILAIIIAIFLLGAKTGIAESKFYKSIVYSDVGGLILGAPVRLSGVNVGSVVNIEFLNKPVASNKRVKVTLSILSQYKTGVDQCTIYAIKTEGLLGDKLVAIEFPKEGENCQLETASGYVIGQDPVDIKNLADDFGQAARYFGDLSHKMSSLADNIYSFVSTSKRTINRLEERLIEGSLFSLFPSSK